MTEAREAFYRVCRGCGQFVWTKDDNSDRLICSECSTTDRDRDSGTANGTSNAR